MCVFWSVVHTWSLQFNGLIELPFSVHDNDYLKLFLLSLIEIGKDHVFYTLSPMKAW